MWPSALHDWDQLCSLPYKLHVPLLSISHSQNSQNCSNLLNNSWLNCLALLLTCHRSKNLWVIISILRIELLGIVGYPGNIATTHLHTWRTPFIDPNGSSPLNWVLWKYEASETGFPAVAIPQPNALLQIYACARSVLSDSRTKRSVYE